VKIAELSIGQSASFSKTISESDVYLFAGITGDLNPVHINDEHAKTSIFKGRVAHGMLTASFISTVLGMYLPGPGTILAKQDIKYLVPVYFGDTITAICTVKEKIEVKKLVVFDCKIVNQDDKTVIVGSATILLQE